jgi:hypothetical protein
MSLFENGWFYDGFGLTVFFPAALLASIGPKFGDGQPDGYAGATGLALGAIYVVAATPKALGKKSFIKRCVESKNGMDKSRTGQFLWQIAAIICICEYQRYGSHVQAEGSTGSVE